MKITLTGLGGTGTSTVGRMIAEQLGITFKSGGSFQREAAAAHGMSVYEWDEYVKSHPEHDLQVEEMQKRFVSETPAYVLESRLSWFVAPEAFNVRMDCDFEVRIQRIANREGISFDDAKKLNIERVNTYNDRFGSLYNIPDFVGLDDSRFDFVIDTSTISPREVAEVIITKAEEFYARQ